MTLTGAGSHAEIRVADTGQGIAGEFLPRLFERFSQADASTTRQHGGLGLGLAVARALVERHGGSIQAESPGPGLGATFTVRIPVLSARTADEAERRAREVTPGTVREIRLDGIRIVLVEDDDDVRELLGMILEMAGAKVAAAASVRAALDALGTVRPHVIVSDVGMPNEDGFALMRQVRARAADSGGNTPAIALTGYTRPEDRARLLAAGFQTHVRKPVEPDEILAAIASLLAIGGR